MKTQALSIALLLLGAGGVASADQDDNHRGTGHDWLVASADQDDNQRGAGHDWLVASADQDDNHRGAGHDWLVASADQDDNHRGAGHDWLVASADRGYNHRVVGGSHDWFHDRRDSTLEAPEIDPVSMVAALTLLGGAFAVSRGRRPKS